jgi:hypothetical protein
MPLETLETVKLSLAIADDGGTDDGLLTQLQKAADAYIEAHCRRNFRGGTFTEFHPGGRSLVFLGNWPVDEVASVRVDESGEYGDDTEMPADQYRVHAERGVIEALEWSFVPRLPGYDPGPNAFPRAVRVTYTTATDAVPEPIARASVELIGHWYRQAKTYAATAQKNMIQDGTTIYPWGQSTGYKVPESVKAMLAPYRVPAL